MKKLFAIIMSVLMIACFMPSMAFADTQGGYSSDYKVINLSEQSGTLTITDQKVVLTGTSTGGVDVKINNGDFSELVLDNAAGIKSIKMEWLSSLYDYDKVDQGISFKLKGENKISKLVEINGAIIISGENEGASLTVGSENAYYETGLGAYRVVINSGKITAYGNGGRAAIGWWSHLVTINGGIVNATSSGKAAAIGGSEGADGFVTINGGTVTAAAKGMGAAIGSSAGSKIEGNVVWITGGTVNASSQSGSAIGSGKDASGDGLVQIEGGTINATSTSGALIGIRKTNRWGATKLYGGSFNFGLTDYANYIMPGYCVVENGGRYKVVPAVAKVNDVEYGTLDAAIGAAKSGDTITLVDDITAGVTIPAGKTVVIDLNGKDISSSTGCAIVNKGNLTISGSGNVSTTAANSAAIANFPDAVANVNGGTYVSSNWYVIKNMGKMTIDGDVEVKKPENSVDTSSLIDNGWVATADTVAGESVSAQANKAELTIKNGEFSGKAGLESCSVVKNDDYGELTISGGTFDSTNNKGQNNATTILNWHKATISGGTFVGQYPISNGAYTYESDKGEFTITGGTFTGVERIFGKGEGGNGKGTVTVAGGSFAAPELGGDFANEAGGYTLAIAGGTFSMNPLAYVAKDAKVYKTNAGQYKVNDSTHTSGYNTWTLNTSGADKGVYTESYVSHSGGSSSSTTTTTDNVTNKTEDKAGSTTASTTATVKAETKTSADGTKTTTATVDTTTAADIVKKTVENKSEEVVVNTTTTTAQAVTETSAGTKTEVALPEQTVKSIANETEAAVTIKSDAAEVKLDKEAVKAVAEQAGDTGAVSLVVETVAQSETKVEVDLRLVTSKGSVTEFKGGNVTVTIKLNTELAAKPVVCVYIDDFGTYHKVSGQKNANGTYTFVTGHFSSYAVMAEDDADKVITEQTENVEKLVGDLTLKARSVKTAKGSIKVTLTVDEDAIKAIEDLGYTVKYKFYRSTKKAKSYKAKIEGTGKTYTNTAGTKGTRYYYKARVMVYDAQGALVAKTALIQCRYACRIR